MSTPLDIARERFDALLERARGELRLSGDDREAASRTSLAWFHRQRAVVALLADYDLTALRTELSASVGCFLELHARFGAGLACSGKYRCSSRHHGVIDALVHGDPELIRRVASQAALPFQPEWEYEDDALRAELCRRLALGEQRVAELEPLLLRWEEVAEGASEPVREVYAALIAGDAKSLPDTLHSAFEAQAQAVEEYKARIGADPVVAATDGALYLEGLALLRLARLRGLPLPPEHRLCPTAVLGA